MIRLTNADDKLIDAEDLKSVNLIQLRSRGMQQYSEVAQRNEEDGLEANFIKREILCENSATLTYRKRSKIGHAVGEGDNNKIKEHQEYMREGD